MMDVGPEVFRRRQPRGRHPGSGEPAGPTRRGWVAGMFGFKVIRQYERGVVVRWGRSLPGIREPGLTWVNPFTDRLLSLIHI